MSQPLRAATVLFFALGAASVAHGGWGHFRSHHYGYAPVGYAPVGYAPTGNFIQSGGVAGVLLGDRPANIQFGTGVIDIGLDIGGSSDDVGEVIEVRSIPTRTVRTYRYSDFDDYDSGRTRVVRSYRYSDYDDDYEYDDDYDSDLRDDVDGLKEDVARLSRSMRELRRRVDALDGGDSDEPESEGTGSLGDVTKP